MPIFDDILSPEAVWPVEAPWPLRRAMALIERFRSRFPSVYYDMDWETRLLNAQAYIGERGRSVRLYGGLGRHRQIGVEGVAFALAHETGHHLGGPPHHTYYATISSEERSNEWAMQTGLPLIFGEDVARRYVRHGLEQLAAIWTKYCECFQATCDLSRESRR
jgi:Zn-dependent protease with chaperone function